MYCDEKHPAALDLHHRDKGGKVATVRQLVDRDRPLSAIQAEMDKCDVVCSNCHRKLHFMEGSTAYWAKGDRQSPTVIQEAAVMRDERNRKYPVRLKLA